MLRKAWRRIGLATSVRCDAFAYLCADLMGLNLFVGALHRWIRRGVLSRSGPAHSTKGPPTR